MRMTRRKGLEEERGMERDEGGMIVLVLPFGKEKEICMQFYHTQVCITFL